MTLNSIEVFFDQLPKSKFYSCEKRVSEHSKIKLKNANFLFVLIIFNAVRIDNLSMQLTRIKIPTTFSTLVLLIVLVLWNSCQKNFSAKIPQITEKSHLFNKNFIIFEVEKTASKFFLISESVSSLLRIITILFILLHLHVWSRKKSVLFPAA